MRKILKIKYIIFSLLFHIIVIFIFLRFLSPGYFPSRVRILGAHSSKVSNFYFKPLYLKTTPVKTNTSDSNSFIKETSIKKVQDQDNQRELKKSDSNKTDVIDQVKKDTIIDKGLPITKPELNKKDELVKKELKDQEIKIGNEAKSHISDKKIDKNVEQKSEEKVFSISANDKRRLNIIEKKICQAFSKVWTPPVNVPKGTECKLRFYIDSRGKIKKFILEKPSKILIYDMSIISAIDKVIFPREVWGQCIPLEFVQ